MNQANRFPMILNGRKGFLKLFKMKRGRMKLLYKNVGKPIVERDGLLNNFIITKEYYEKVVRENKRLDSQTWYDRRPDNNRNHGKQETKEEAVISNNLGAAYVRQLEILVETFI